MTLSEAIARYLPAVEDAMRCILSPPSDEFKRFYGMMRYHQGWLDEALQPQAGASGKRVRPVLCLLCCQAVGGQYETATSLAAAIELMHSFTLVHDDIEDRSETRRHRRTVWALWGEAHGVNVGDAIFAAAHLGLYQLSTKVQPALALELAAAFDDTCLRLCEGQYLDMDFEGRREVSVSEYMTMIERKTAALMALAAWSGARAGGADERRAEAFRGLGLELGLAFQIQDDLLGVWGDEHETGKSTSTDIASAKKTLPYILALETLPAPLAQELTGLYSLSERGPAEVQRARELIELSRARERCEQAAQEHHGAALEHLRASQAEPGAAQALVELIEQLGGRRA